MTRWGLVLAGAVGCGFAPNVSVDARPIDGPPTVDDTPVPDLDAPGPPIAFRQVSSTEGINQSSATVTFAKAQLPGDLDVVMVGWYKVGTVMSVVDSSNNTYVLAVGPTMTVGMESHAIYYACNIAAASANANTVTVTFQGAGQDPDVRIVEYAGIRTAVCLDRATTNIGVGTAIDSGPLTTTHAHDLLVGGNKVFYLTSAGDASYVTRTITGYGDLVEDHEVTAVGTYNATATENMPGAWVMQLVAFAGS